MSVTRQAPLPGASFGATVRLGETAGEIVAAAERGPKALPAALAEAATRSGQILVDSVSQWLAAVVVARESLAEDLLEADINVKF